MYVKSTILVVKGKRMQALFDTPVLRRDMVDWLDKKGLLKVRYLDRVGGQLLILINSK